MHEARYLLNNNMRMWKDFGAFKDRMCVGYVVVGYCCCTYPKLVTVPTRRIREGTIPVRGKGSCRPK